MVKIVSSPADIKGFKQDEFYRVYETDAIDGELRAVATTVGEALDAREMLNDLTGKTYHISPPRAESN